MKYTQPQHDPNSTPTHLIRMVKDSLHELLVDTVSPNLSLLPPHHLTQLSYLLRQPGSIGIECRLYESKWQFLINSLLCASSPPSLPPSIPPSLPPSLPPSFPPSLVCRHVQDFGYIIPIYLVAYYLGHHLYFFKQ